MASEKSQNYKSRRKITAVKGMQDILPPETRHWQWIETKARNLSHRYGFGEIRTPIVEHTEVFLRGVGSGTDIVDKEMYTFEDKGGRSLTLRAEGTAPVMRAFLENNLGKMGLPVRLYYICPIFRYDRPQAGRYRQHTQFGAEVIGSSEGTADAEVLSLAVRLLQMLGIQQFDLRISSVGDEVCRPDYESLLRAYYKPRLQELCEDCQRRFLVAPMRLLDCKHPHDKAVAAQAPRILDHLCGPCEKHFSLVLSHLDAMSIQYIVDPLIVRGLNYYTRTAWEATSGGLGAQNVVFGGGRYDGLAEQLGGDPTPGVGFGMGIERLLKILQDQRRLPLLEDAVDVFVATADAEDSLVKQRNSLVALAIADQLRQLDLIVVTDVMGRSLNAQMKNANRANASFTLIVGLGQGFAFRNMVGKRDVLLPLHLHQLSTNLRDWSANLWDSSLNWRRFSYNPQHAFPHTSETPSRPWGPLAEWIAEHVKQWKHNAE